MQNDTEYKYCLNCNSELHGKYCHNCGQQASGTQQTVWEFLMEYLNIAFIWDAHFIKTFWKLVTRPGHLTNEYVAGKYIAYTHPLKLNMFLMFVFISILLLFHSTEDLNSTVHKVTRDERLLPAVQLDILSNDQAYMEKIKASQTDTVQVYAPFFLLESYPEIIGDIDNANQKAIDSIGVLTAVIPHILIEDKVLELHPQGYYIFTNNDPTGEMGIRILENIWAQMISLFTRFFPLFILLTAPFLAFLLHILNRRGRHSRLKHFIFALHYTALLELLVIALYIMFLIASPSASLMQGILTVGSYLYLTLAVRSVYGTKNWFLAFGKAVAINLGYLGILIMLFITIVLISLIIVGINM